MDGTGNHFEDIKESQSCVLDQSVTQQFVRSSETIGNGNTSVVCLHLVEEPAVMSIS